MTARAPAKINLALRVGPLRANGYHDLATVFHAVSLHEEVTAEEADDFSVTVEGDECAGVPTSEDNLAVRAARLLAKHAKIDAGVHLTIRKAVPVAGGMAGGSADAAAALVACDALWRTDVARADLQALAARLGSDVPFALVGGTVLGTGRGDRLSPVLGRGEYHWVLAIADEGLATPQVYERLDTLRTGHVVPEPGVDPEILSALRAGDVRALAAALDNDLQAAAVACAPRLRATLEAGDYAGALAGIVSGSGPTCAFLVRDAQHALDVAISLSAAGVCRTVRRVHGPVPGARVVLSG